MLTRSANAVDIHVGRRVRTARLAQRTSQEKLAEAVGVSFQQIQKYMEHGRRFTVERLADAQPRNDGRQTPMRGHPIFIAQHATATCCRSCLAKWHRIPQGQPLTPEQIDYILAVLGRWLFRSVVDKLRDKP